PQGREHNPAEPVPAEAVDVVRRRLRRLRRRRFSFPCVSGGGRVPSTEKVEKVEKLKERIDGSAALLLADYRGLTTSDVMELRRSLVQAGTRFAVVKNTLMKRAVEESGISEVSGLLEGPTA